MGSVLKHLLHKQHLPRAPASTGEPPAPGVCPPPPSPRAEPVRLDVLGGGAWTAGGCVRAAGLGVKEQSQCVLSVPGSPPRGQGWLCWHPLLRRHGGFVFPRPPMARRGPSVLVQGGLRVPGHTGRGQLSALGKQQTPSSWCGAQSRRPAGTGLGSLRRRLLTGAPLGPAALASAITGITGITAVSAAGAPRAGLSSRSSGPDPVLSAGSTRPPSSDTFVFQTNMFDSLPSGKRCSRKMSQFH